MINKNEPKVEERKKRKMETSSRVINKQEPKVGERRKEKVETSSKMINKQKPKVEKIAVAEVMESDDNSEELEGGIFWKEFQRKMLRTLLILLKLLTAQRFLTYLCKEKLLCSHMI